MVKPLAYEVLAEHSQSFIRLVLKPHQRDPLLLKIQRPIQFSILHGAFKALRLLVALWNANNCPIKNIYLYGLDGLIKKIKKMAVLFVRRYRANKADK